MLNDAFRTERLIIRRIQESDWDDVLRIWEDFAASEYVMYDVPRNLDPEAVRRRIAVWASYSKSDEHLFMAVCLDDTVIGYFAFNENKTGYETGYCFCCDHAGKGYASESFRAIAGRLKENGVSVITAGTAMDNEPSVKFLTRNGFVLTGLERLSFCSGSDGKPFYFIGGEFELTL
ncbi:MAG: GNAT family N-acetyltransferase [Oscillospiraceae bacterium]|nr:GNAT family N-acetyltransferase [Oscillospiraceae bacterium]